MELVACLAPLALPGQVRAEHIPQFERAYGQPAVEPIEWPFDRASYS